MIKITEDRINALLEKFKYLKVGEPNKPETKDEADIREMREWKYAKLKFSSFTDW